MRGATFDRRKSFFLIKAIDGMPRVNGSLQIQGLRIVRFLTQTPRFWYEPVRSVDELLVILRLAATLESAGVPARAHPKPALTLQLFESAHHSSTGVIQLPAAGEKPLALHVIVPLRLADDGRSIEFWNSWGSRWGHGGNGSVSLDYLNIYFHEAWCLWDARWGLTSWKEELTQIDNPKRLRQVWMTENPVSTRKMLGTRRGDSWYVETFHAYSPCDDSGIEVVQLRNGYGLRMGWAFQCHIRDTTTSEIRELFVMPAFRHQGIGTCLEGISCELARAMQSTEMKATIHEADGGVLANRGAARKFLRLTGYKMHWRKQAGPRAIGFGTKNL